MLGNQMFLADHFSKVSKATIAEEKQDENHDKLFTGELEKLNPFHASNLLPERSFQLKMCTAQEPVLMTLKITAITGWPKLREQVTLPAREHWL